MHLPKSPIPCVRYAVVAAACVIPTFALADQPEGFLEPYHEIELSASGEPGLITSIRVREGQRVFTEELLIEFDVRVLQASLAIAKSRAESLGRMEAAKAEVELRNERFANLEKLHQKGHASRAEMQRAATDLRISVANQQAAQEEIQLAKLECDRIEAQIEERRLRSPIDGVVVDIFREIGETTQRSDSHLLLIVQLDRLKVKFPVSVSQAAQLHEGDIVPIQLPEIDGETHALVSVVSPVLDAKSGTVEVTCVVDNSKNKFRSGMRCMMPVNGSDPPSDLEETGYERLDSQVSFESLPSDRP